MMKECGDSSDDEDYPLLGEWRGKGFGNPVIQDIRIMSMNTERMRLCRGQSILALKL